MKRPTKPTISNPHHARQGITTRFVGPTNYRGPRIIARSASGHRMTVPWDHALDVYENHAAAALALASKLEWHGRWVGGATREGYAFVLDTRE